MTKPQFLPARLPLVLLLVALLAGCAATPTERRSIAELAASIDQIPAERTSSALTPGVEEMQELDERAEPLLFAGNDRMFRAPTARPQVSLKGEAVSLRFEQAPVGEVVHAILGDLLEADYSIVQPLSGELTLHTHKPVPRDQMLGLLESLLLARGIVMVPDVNGRYQVGLAEDIQTAIPVPAMASNLPVGYSMVIVPLQYIGAAAMAEILQPVTEPNNLFRVDHARNLVVLAGTRTQIEGWMELVSTFDVDFLAGLSVGLFPLEYASVYEVDSALRTLFSSSDAPSAAGGGLGAAAAGAAGDSRRGGTSRGEAGASSGTAGAAPQAVEVGGPLSGLVRVLPIERLNALLVVSSRKHYLEQARVWIERLDRPLDGGAEPQLYVYSVQNGSARHLASLLSGLYGGSESESSTTTAPRSTDSGLAPGLSRGMTGSGLTPGRSTSGLSGRSSMAGSASDLMGDGLAGGMTQVSLEGNVRIVADEHNNALLIYAPRKDYRKIEAALRQLDIAPMQVLIEASILEVTLNDELRYGLQWYFQNGLGGGRTGVGQLTSGESSVIGPDNPGFSYSILSGSGSIRAVLSALAQKNLLNVISTPSVMVQDNHTAMIQVGDQQPIRSGTSTTDGGVVTESIQYKDTGVMLAVSPSVNAGGLVTMMVHQTVTDVGPQDIPTGQRSFMQRELSSRVAVRSGETLVLGGLIRDNSSRVRQGLPILHDIPVLGNLFGSTAIATDRTELLVMITPRVVRNEADMKDVNAEIRGRMRSIESLVERQRLQEQGE